MKSFPYVLVALFFSVFALAQDGKQEDKRDDYLNEPIDTTLGKPVQLEEIYINPNQMKIDEEAKRRFLILQRRVYKVYPYARAASGTLTSLNAGMAKLSSNREKKKYFKIVEDYLENQFEPQLKKLSRKDGQILVKLICRQTGSTTFDLIKEYKSGWKAFWSNNTAKLFDINLKTGYAPFEVNEDYWIETILVRAFASGGLQSQEAAHKIDYDELSDFWVEKLSRPKPQAKAD